MVNVIYKDSHVLVVDKPPGLVVDRTATQHTETLEDQLRAQYPAQEKLERAGIVHRLDKETSGLLVVARTFLAREHLITQFKERRVLKQYLALLHGDLREEIVITLPIGRNPHNRERFTIVESGKQAQTKFVPQAWYGIEPEALLCWKLKLKPAFLASYVHFTFCAVYPKTGRTHQIRVHAKFHGTPLVADPAYAGRKIARIDHHFCPRLFLHATSLTFVHPDSKAPHTFTSPLPDDLTHALDTLKMK